MIRREEKGAHGSRNNRNSSRLDKTKTNKREHKNNRSSTKLANRQAPLRQHYIQSRKGVSAPGSTCRPEPLASNSGQERYT
jgi:hypothetical protein